LICETKKTKSLLRGILGERLTLGFDFILSLSVSGKARLFYEQPKSPGVTIPLMIILAQLKISVKQPRRIYEQIS